MKLQPSHDKLVTADDSELGCRGFVDITVDDIPTKALVTNSLNEELIIGWPDMIRLGIISPNFPKCSNEHIKAISDIVGNEDAEKLKTELQTMYLSIVNDKLPENPIAGP